MKRRARPQPSRIDDELSPLVRLWVLRVLVTLGGHRSFLYEGGYNNDRLAAELGLPEEGSPDFCELPGMRRQLREMLARCESTPSGTTLPAPLSGNLDRLASLLALTALERELLGFAALLHTDRVLGEAANYLGALSTVSLHRTLACLLKAPEDLVRAALAPNGVLARTGLLTVSLDSNSSLDGKLEVLSPSFAERLSSSDADPMTLLRDMARLAPPPTLGMDDFRHVKPTLQLLRSHLGAALADGRPGVNVLLHGAPGVGKTELARVLAEALGCALYEVSSEDATGDPVGGEDRLRGLRVAQAFFAGQRAVLAFDEAEDIFNDGGLFQPSIAQRRKAWMNRALEEGSMPTLWMSNDVGCLDPAFIRRFDVVLELPVPPREQRQRLLRDASGGRIDEAQIERLARVPALAPAVVTRAFAVARGASPESADLGPVVEMLIDATLRAQGHRGLPKRENDGLPDFYDPSFINADVDLDTLATRLVGRPSARILLHGPPGTGKTAWARWLARRLRKPLLVRRASDLLSCYVGESEKNIASAFAQAERDEAVLLIDEVDSFLQNRDGLRAGWEVTQVNEFLTCLDEFRGLVVATTNRKDALDPAVLRRFHVHVAVGAMTANAIAASFERLRCQLALPSAAMELAVLFGLVPSDLAGVVDDPTARIATCQDLLEFLKKRVSSRRNAKERRYGFV